VRPGAITPSRSLAALEGAVFKDKHVTGRGAAREGPKQPRFLRLPVLGLDCEPLRLAAPRFELSGSARIRRTSSAMLAGDATSKNAATGGAVPR
jgi:hypothetical protein